LAPRHFAENKNTRENVIQLYENILIERKNKGMRVNIGSG